MSATCLACGGSQLEHVVDLGHGPAFVGASWPDEAGARRAPRGRLDLWLCQRCGHVANGDFDPSLLDYDGAYDNSLHHSPVFRDYADELARRLISSYEVRRVVELGSGKGEFLTELCERSGATGTGYDPTCEAGQPTPDVTLVSDYYRPGEHLEPYDLLVCRQVLEHLDDPAAVLQSIRAEAPRDAVLYLEVPAGEFNFGPDGLWDCIYPHVSYFSASSLEALVRRCGFEVLDSGKSFADQFLWIEVRPGDVVDRPVAPDAHLDLVRDFGRRREATVAAWRARVAEEGDLVLWGAGAKGVSFLNAIDSERRLTVVDLNPRKWGRFLPGTGHRVESPHVLAEYDVERVVVTNPAYCDEIAAQLADLGLSAPVVTV